MTSKDSIPDVGANGSRVFMAAFHLLSSSAPVSSMTEASSAAFSMQLSSARVGGFTPARETATAAALAATRGAGKAGHSISPVTGTAYLRSGILACWHRMQGDRAQFASRRPTRTHNWNTALFQLFPAIMYRQPVETHSRIMQKDLNEAQSWPEEARALAEETLLRLGNIMEAAN